MSHEYWRSHFASDRKLIGKVLTLDGKPYTVIGIAPDDVDLTAPDTQMWMPLTFSAAERNDHENRSLDVIARLKQEASLKKAQTEMDLIARRLAMQSPKTNAGRNATVEPFRGRDIEGVLRAAILALAGAVLFVLMIVCVNATSVLLARGTTRQGEMAVRAALGASRLRLVRQLVVEGVVLAGAALHKSDVLSGRDL